VKKITFDKVRASEIDTVVEKLGPEVTQLSMEVEHSEFLGDKPFDITKVLAACPKLNTLKVKSFGPFKKSTTPLNPSYFEDFAE